MTKLNVVQIGICVFLLGAIGYGTFLFLGFDSQFAGIAAEAILILLVVVWTASYLLRVVNGKMTFMEQRKRYRAAYEQLTNDELLKKFDSMSEEEQEKIMKETKLDKK